MNLKWKAILSIISIILLIWAGLIGFIYQQGLKDLEQAVEARITSARDIATTLELVLYPSYQKRIRSLVNVESTPVHREMVKAFHDRDRDKLLQLSNRFYRLIKTESPELKSFAWILPDNTAFLRLNLPEVAGDDVSAIRPDIAAANQTRLQVAAYSSSGMGLGYHIVQPVFWQGEYCGAVQFGIDSAHLLNLLTQRLNAPTGVLLPKNKIGFLRKNIQKLPLLDWGEFAMLSASFGDAESSNPQIDWHQDRSWYTDQDRHYVAVRLLPLLDFNQQPAGHIVTKLDLTDEYLAAMARFWAVFGVSSLLILVLFILLYSNFNYLLKKIFQLNHSLEEQNSTLEQRVAERSAELQKSKDEWVAMFNAIPDMVIIQNRDRMITQANQATCDFFQLPAAKLIGKHCYEIFYNRTARCEGCLKAELFQHGSTYKETHCNEALQRTFQITAAPIFRKDSQLDSFVQITQDITEKKRLEEDLIQAQKMEAIGTLAGGIAHDFNNILSAIIGYATMAQMRETEDSLLTRDLDSIIHAGNRAADLVKQILTFSRKDTFNEELFQPHFLLQEVLKMLRSSIPSSIAIVTDIDPESGWIKASQVRIHQVIMNLCTNAVQAMKNDKGTLTLQLKAEQITAGDGSDAELRPGRFIRLSVFDTGSGMDSNTLERIFDPYFTTKSGEQGTGLGLAVVHGIIHDLKGFIRVSSEPGQGSRFDIYLPAFEVQNMPLELTTVGEELPHGTGHLLVVDDEAAIIEITSDLLRELGYRVTAEQDSLKALEKINLQPDRYDLMITDQTMPGLTGLELAQELYRLNPKVPVILCTGYSSVLDGQQPLSDNIKKLMAKPLPFAELATTVKQTLAEKQAG